MLALRTMLASPIVVFYSRSRSIVRPSQTGTLKIAIKTVQQRALPAVYIGLMEAALVVNLTLCVTVILLLAENNDNILMQASTLISILGHQRRVRRRFLVRTMPGLDLCSKSISLRRIKTVRASIPTRSGKPLEEDSSRNLSYRDNAGCRCSSTSKPVLMRCNTQNKSRST